MLENSNLNKDKKTKKDSLIKKDSYGEESSSEYERKKKCLDLDDTSFPNEKENKNASESPLIHTKSIKKNIWAARYGYLVLGSGMAAWASLVPYAKERLNVNESTLGFLLLCLGLGALFSMPIAGALTARFGCKKMQNICIPIFCISLILLTILPHPLTVALTLIIFGGMSGILDVVMNLQVIFLEQASGKRMMSSLHAMYTVGAGIGAGGMTLLLGSGLSPLYATVTLLALFLIPHALFFGRYFYPFGGNKSPSSLIVLPRGYILVLGIICYVIYMVEGVIMDWSALFMNLERNIPTAEAGLAYGLFAVTMTIGRLAGDRLGEFLGAKNLLIASCILTTIGFIMLASIQSSAGSYFCFFLVGLGAANTVPQLFVIVSKQKTMEVTTAIAAVSTVGYLGLLSGPAFMGFVAHYFGLPRIFIIMAILVGIVAFVSTRIREE